MSSKILILSVSLNADIEKYCKTSVLHHSLFSLPLVFVFSMLQRPAEAADDLRRILFLEVGDEAMGNLEEKVSDQNNSLVDDASR